MLRDYLDLKNRKQQNAEVKIMFVHDPILLGWLNGERRWGAGLCNSQKSYKLIYSVIKPQRDAY